MGSMDFLGELEGFRIVGNINRFIGFWHLTKSQKQTGTLV